MTTEIEKRIASLEAERAILKTLHTYGHALDYGREKDFLDCWLPDGTLDWPNVGLLSGHDNLRKAFRAHTHVPELFHKHVVVAPLITLEGDIARVESMYMRLDAVSGSNRITVYGRYRDVLRACSDGAWRFVSRVAESEARNTEGASFIEAI